MERRQVPASLAMESTAPLVAVVVGINDLLAAGSSYDAELFQHNLRTVFHTLTNARTRVVTANYPDVPANLDVPELVRRSLRRRFAEANDTLGEIAATAGVICIDVTREPAWQDSSSWDADRLHPGPRLHQHFAEQMAGRDEHARLLVAT